MGKWKTCTLGELNCYTGSSITPMDTPDTTYELYSVPSWENKYPEIVEGKDIGSTKQSVSKNDVLLCKINPRINRVWVVGQYSENPLIASSEWIVIRNKQLFSKYLYYYLQSPQFRDMLISEQAGIGGSLTRAQPKRVATYPVLIPPLDVQQKIADALDKASALIELRRVQLDKLDLLIKSQFIEMFGDPVLTEKDLMHPRLGEVCKLKSGKFVKASDISEEPTENLYPCYGGNGLRGYVPSYNHEGEYPLIGRQGALCGNVQFATGKFYATEHAVAVTPESLINRYWLYFMLLQLDLNRYASGAAQPGLAVNKLEEIRVNVPVLSEQEQFSDFAKQVDKSKFALQRSLFQLELNYKSLMQKCFRGELF